MCTCYQLGTPATSLPFEPLAWLKNYWNKYLEWLKSQPYHYLIHIGYTDQSSQVSHSEPTWRGTLSKKSLLIFVLYYQTNGLNE